MKRSKIEKDKPSGVAAGPSRLSPMGLSGLHLSLPSKTSGLHISAAPEATSSVEQDAGCVNVNTLVADEMASPSPSSSGIVADMNDSNLESNQRTSATSSLSAGSSSDHSSDHNDYDRPRGTDMGALLQPPAIARTTPPGRQPQPQMVQLRPAQMMRHSRLANGDKCELGSTSVLQNVFEGLSIDRDRTLDEDEPRFSHSLNLDGHLASNRRFFDRSPSIQPENMYMLRGSSEERQKRGTSIAPELIASQKGSDSSASSSFDEDASLRKRAVCARLSENYRLIEMSARKMAECTAPRAWRQPHVLQQHLPDIKEAVTTIANALDSFLDAVGRIAVVANNPKAEGGSLF
ncbi:hypothetical protein Tcan_05236 [Toxocara canis]|uniref:Uncharacterized protein n=1 Tax=Toxocara canis TaxID=6265 RepID=A0A0B2V436_TOXCA|nr:hypothetical protein Tcan_05236 [Toxocara canis]